MCTALSDTDSVSVRVLTGRGFISVFGRVKRNLGQKFDKCDYTAFAPARRALRAVKGRDLENRPALRAGMGQAPEGIVSGRLKDSCNDDSKQYHCVKTIIKTFHNSSFAR